MFPSKQALAQVNHKLEELIEIWFTTLNNPFAPTPNDKTTCHICSTPNNPKSLACDSCKCTFHRKCVGVKAGQAKSMTCYTCLPCKDLPAITNTVMKQHTSPTLLAPSPASSDIPSPLKKQNEPLPNTLSPALLPNTHQLMSTPRPSHSSDVQILPSSAHSPSKPPDPLCLTPDSSVASRSSTQPTSTLVPLSPPKLPSPPRGPTQSTTDDIPHAPANKQKPSNSHDASRLTGWEKSLIEREKELATKALEQQMTITYVKGLEAELRNLKQNPPKTLEYPPAPQCSAPAPASQEPTLPPSGKQTTTPHTMCDTQHPNSHPNQINTQDFRRNFPPPLYSPAQLTPHQPLIEYIHYSLAVLNSKIDNLMASPCRLVLPINPGNPITTLPVHYNSHPINPGNPIPTLPVHYNSHIETPATASVPNPPQTTYAQFSQSQPPVITLHPGQMHKDLPNNYPTWHPVPPTDQHPSLARPTPLPSSDN